MSLGPLYVFLILSPFVSIILPYLWLSLLTLTTFTKNRFATWGMFIKVYRHVLFCCFTLCLVFLRCFLLYTPLFLKCSTFTLHSPLLTSLSSVFLSLKLLILSSHLSAGEMKYMKTRPQWLWAFSVLERPLSSSQFWEAMRGWLPADPGRKRATSWGILRNWPNTFLGWSLCFMETVTWRYLSLSYFYLACTSQTLVSANTCRKVARKWVWVNLSNQNISPMLSFGALWTSPTSRFFLKKLYSLFFHLCVFWVLDSWQCEVDVDLWVDLV